VDGRICFGTSCLARTRRKFSAYLVRGADGKVGFEFEKREPRPAAKAGAAAKAAPKETKPATETPARRRKAGI
jgi:DNA topoisomerase-3